MGRISIQGLTKALGSHRAVTDVNLEIDDHEFVAVMGPSGCGKTTTLRLLAGFLSPDSGRIVIDGIELSTPEQVVPPEQRGLGMVFQQYAIWPHMNVFDNVAFGLRVRKCSRNETRDRVADALRLVGLGGLEKRRPSQLSGGQLQRVALARALVVEPTTLLLDEPLSNLDSQLRERMRFELKELQQRTGITFVYVTHDQAEAMALADRVAVMEAGSVVQWGPPREVYERPVGRFVADFLGTVNWLSGSVVDHEHVRLDAGCELWIPPMAHACSAGDAVDVGIRPEDVVISGGHPGTEANVLQGSVREVLFLGNLVYYQVETEHDRLLAQTVRSQAFSVGERVFAVLPQRACSALPAEPGPHRDVLTTTK